MRKFNIGTAVVALFSLVGTSFGLDLGDEPVAMAYISLPISHPAGARHSMRSSSRLHMGIRMDLVNPGTEPTAPRRPAVVDLRWNRNGFQNLYLHGVASQRLVPALQAAGYDWLSEDQEWVAVALLVTAGAALCVSSDTVCKTSGNSGGNGDDGNDGDDKD